MKKHKKIKGPKIPELLVHKHSFKIAEHFQSILGPAITFVDLDEGDNVLVTDLADEGLFIFDDDPKYNLKEYVKIGVIE